MLLERKLTEELDMELKSHVYIYHLYRPKPYIDKMKE